MTAKRYLPIAVFGATILFFVFWQTTAAKPPEKPGNPGVPGLLAEISELQETIDQQTADIDELHDMLDQLQNLARVQQTGQTQSHANGDDGDIRAGVHWPDTRFTDNLDGTVTDHLTGLIWIKNADCEGRKTWANAIIFSNNLANGDCELMDGSIPGDWRLPNRKELESLLDLSQIAALPHGHPFERVRGGAGDDYWSSTTYAPHHDQAWYMEMYNGVIDAGGKSYESYAWPVRDGQ